MDNLKTARQLRLESIERELYWFGVLTKRRIKDQFGVDLRTVQTDIRDYREYEKGDVTYDAQAIRWVAKPDFHPRFDPPNAEDLLYRLARERRLSAPAAYAPAAHLPLTTPDEIPIYAPPELLRRRIAPECLRTIISAIRRNAPQRKGRKRAERVELRIAYSSPNHDSEQIFWIGPHALNHDSFRWAVRAFREDHGHFGDVVLDRVTRVIDERVSERDFADEDEEWNRIVDVELEPNPRLSAEARKHIELQYDMCGGVLKVPVRQAFIVYFLKRHQIEEKSTKKAPHQEPLVVKNRKKITALIPARMRIPPEMVARANDRPSLTRRPKSHRASRPR